MLIDTVEKVLFIHVPKAAGSSITNSLRSALIKKSPCPWPVEHGPEDVNLSEGIPRFCSKYMQSLHLEGRSSKHSSYKLLCLRVEENNIPINLHEYFSFAFVRNPWDRMYSYWNFLWQSALEKEVRGMGFNGWISEIYKRRKEYKPPTLWYEGPFYPVPQSEFIEGVSFVGRFEDLEKDLDYVGRRIGCKITCDHQNSTQRVNNEHYKDIYSEKSIEIIREMFKSDIELFGYSYR